MFDYEGTRGEFLKILAEMGEEPAFISRGNAPQIALDDLLNVCTAHRQEQLKWPRRHFTTLRRRVSGDWSRLKSYLADQKGVDLLLALEGQLASDERDYSWFFLTTDKRALRQFYESAERFNKHWSAFITGAGLDHVNELRENYNRFYPMEKACAFGNDSVNKGFQPLPPLDASMLFERFPLLTLPELR